MPHCDSQSSKIRRFCICPVYGAMLWLIVTLVMGCSAVQPISEPGDASYLEFDIQPETAEIYIDGDYSGTVDGWREQVVPIEPGHRRVELHAEGYISQRFDVEVDHGRWMTLRVRMEPVIEGPQPEAPENGEDDDATIQTPSHPTAPEPDPR